MSDVLDILEGPALDREAQRMKAVLNRAAAVVRSETGGFLTQAGSEIEFDARCEFAADILDRVSRFELSQFKDGREFLLAALRREWHAHRGRDVPEILPLRQASQGSVTLQVGERLYVMASETDAIAIFPATEDGQMEGWRPVAETSTVAEALRAVEATPIIAARTIDQAFAEIGGWSYTALRGALRRVAPELLGEYPDDRNNRDLLIEELLLFEFGPEAESFQPPLQSKVEAPVVVARDLEIPGVDWAELRTLSSRQYRQWLLSWITDQMETGSQDSQAATALANRLAAMTDVSTPVILAELEREAQVISASRALANGGVEWARLVTGDWVYLASDEDRPVVGIVEVLGEDDGQVVASVRSEQDGELYECSPVQGYSIQRLLDGDAFRSARRCAGIPDMADDTLLAIHRSFEGCALESLPSEMVDFYRAATVEINSRRIALPVAVAAVRLALEAEVDPEYEGFTEDWVEVANSRGLCACGQMATHLVWAPVASARKDLVCPVHRAGAVAKYVTVAAPLFPLVERHVGESR